LQAHKEKKLAFGLPPENASSGGVWLVTLTDLYLVILVFFILLNSISASDKMKNDKAMDSINGSFKGKPGAVEANTIPKFFDFPSRINNYFNSIEELMRHSLRLKNLNVEKSDNIMVITFPAAALFENDSADIKEGQQEFMKGLENILLQDMGGAKISFDIKIEVVAEANNNYETDIARAKLIVGSMLSAGMEGELISGGMALSDTNNIIMTFTGLEHIDPKIGIGK
jgi:flagellar motor protein MotB